MIVANVYYCVTVAKWGRGVPCTNREVKQIKKTIKIASILMVYSDLDRIQTYNLLSRNQVRYSVAPRGRFFSCAKIDVFFD